MVILPKNVLRNCQFSNQVMNIAWADTTSVTYLWWNLLRTCRNHYHTPLWNDRNSGRITYRTFDWTPLEPKWRVAVNVFSATEPQSIKCFSCHIKWAKQNQQNQRHVIYDCFCLGICCWLRIPKLSWIFVLSSSVRVNLAHISLHCSTHTQGVFRFSPVKTKFFNQQENGAQHLLVGVSINDDETIPRNVYVYTYGYP